MSGKVIIFEKEGLKEIQLYQGLKKALSFVSVCLFFNTTEAKFLTLSENREHFPFPWDSITVTQKS